MALPKNGVAKEIRSYAGSLFIFLFVIGTIVTLLQFPVLESNKEVVMMLIGTIAASIPVVISAITGTKPDDVNGLKNEATNGDSSQKITQPCFLNDVPPESTRYDGTIWVVFLITFFHSTFSKDNFMRLDDGFTKIPQLSMS